MERRPLNRRDFNRLTGAALGGAMAGVSLGCSQSDGQAVKKEADEPVDVTTAEVHICRGLNACKGKGKGGDNACAGQGVCATAQAHGCHGENKCKGQGGCGANPGLNACKGKGACAVPVEMEPAWKKAREHFEQAMTKAGKKFGEAPPPPAKS